MSSLAINRLALRYRALSFLRLREFVIDLVVSRLLSLISQAAGA
jgi:hypothetical protein